MRDYTGINVREDLGEADVEGLEQRAGLARGVGMREQEAPPSTFISIEQNDYLLFALLAVPRIAVGPKNVLLPFKIAAGYIVEKSSGFLQPRRAENRRRSMRSWRSHNQVRFSYRSFSSNPILMPSTSHAACTRAMTCQNASFTATPVPANASPGKISHFLVN